MKNFKVISLIALVFIFLFNSCALPLAIMGLNNSGDQGFSENKEIDMPDIDFNEEYTIAIVLENTSADGSGSIIAGEYNSIRIFVPEGVSPENVILESSAGTIERTESDSTLFRIFVTEPGLAVEIIARDTLKGYSGIFYGESIELPAPTPCLNMNDNGEFDVERFKKQGQLMLKNEQQNLPQLCKCLGFIIIRISSDSIKEAVKNDGDAFTNNTKNLISKAQKGDIFIFDEIKIQCAANSEPKKLRSLVYILK